MNVVQPLAAPQPCPIGAPVMNGVVGPGEGQVADGHAERQPRSDPKVP